MFTKPFPVMNVALAATGPAVELPGGVIVVTLLADAVIASTKTGSPSENAFHPTNLKCIFFSLRILPPLHLETAASALDPSTYSPNTGCRMRHQANILDKLSME